MKYALIAAVTFLTGCASTSTTIVVADKLSPNNHYRPEIRLEFKINEFGAKNDVQRQRPERNW